MNQNRPALDEKRRTVLQRSYDAIGSVLGVESSEGRVIVTPANLLTIFRLAIIPFFWKTFLSSSPQMRLVATALFILGALSDLWDGKLARRKGHETPFGDFMDPFADKLLVLSAFWAFLIRDDFGVYMTTAVIWVSLITLREILLTVLRMVRIENGSSLVTSVWGKWKTGIHLTVLIALLLLGNLRDFIMYSGKDPGFLNSGLYFLLVNILFLVCVFPSLVSGIIYFISIRRKSQAGH